MDTDRQGQGLHPFHIGPTSNVWRRDTPQSATRQYVKKLRNKAVIIGRTISRDPLTIAIPLAVMSIMLALSLWGLYSVSVATAAGRRQEVAVFARDIGQNLASHIEATVTPATTMMRLIQMQPDWPTANAVFHKVAPSLISAGRQTDAIITIVLAPHGIARAFVPDNLPGWSAAVGLDLLRNQTWRVDALKAVTLRSQLGDQSGLVMTGPRPLRAGPMGIVARQAVFIDNALPNDTFNAPGEAYDCPPCFVPATANTTSRKFWGFAQLNVDWIVLTEQVTGIYRLCSDRGGLIDFNMTYVDTATGRNVSIAGCGKVASDPVCIDVDIMANHWVLCASDSRGWHPNWWPWSLAVVIVTSVLVALVIAAAMMKHRQHMWLLQAALPAKVIETLSRGDDYVEGFESVTVLFSDIVSYTVMAAQMEPLEVVRLLGQVYNTFDELVDQYGCFKVETIGDAFMVVAGTQGETARQAARKMARLAGAMLRSGEGLGVQFRLGMHSGPVVGAVVGFKMPHFCLFGDTVNVASRMESHGQPMRIHISEATAGLLMDHAADEGFNVVERGFTEIKGKGEMRTFWLEPVAADLPVSSPTKLRSSVDLRLFHV